MVQVHVTFGDNADTEWKWFGYVAVTEEEAEVLLEKDYGEKYDEVWNRFCNKCERQIYGLRPDWFIEKLKKAE